MCHANVTSCMCHAHVTSCMSDILALVQHRMQPYNIIYNRHSSSSPTTTFSVVNSYVYLSLSYHGPPVSILLSHSFPSICVAFRRETTLLNIWSSVEPSTRQLHLVVRGTVHTPTSFIDVFHRKLSERTLMCALAMNHRQCCR